MNDPKSPPRRSAATPSARDQRLAKALRDNLRRRKAPTAAVDAPHTPPTDDPAAGETD